MLSARPITNFKGAFFILFFICTWRLPLQAQENSPYSRFGLGDILSSQNVINRSMGGLSIPYSDMQSVNFINPASYANLKLTTLDIGVEFDSRTLHANNPVKKYNSKYLIPTYLQLGLPLKKKGHWGMNIGLRPVTRINYNLSSRTRLEGIDSVLYNYSGTGGSYQAFLGTGFGHKNFSFGINAGYMFGNKLYNTRVIFLNDSVPYRKTNSADTTRLGGLFIQGGIQYRLSLGGSMALRFGANGSLENKLKAVRDISRETFEFNPGSGTITLDSIYQVTEEPGTIIMPASFGIGIMLEREDKWSFGAEFNKTMWASYRYYGQPDNLKNSWTIRAGGQLIPNATGKSYWTRVAYRAGFSFGPDPVDLGKKLNQYLVTFGTALPVRRSFYTNQYTTINLAIEAGARGNKNNEIRESIFRMSVGMNLSDIWFNPRKYD
jgi:hypothetical protein